MISAQYYQFIFLLITIILTLFYSDKYNCYGIYKIANARVTAKQDSVQLLVLFMTLFIGLRPNSYIFWDMLNYLAEYQSNEGGRLYFNMQAENFLFDNVFAFWCSNQLGFTNLMLLMSTINFGCTYLACRRFFPNDTMVSYLVFLGAFSTFSYATNGLKAGTAAGIFLLGLSFYKKWKVFFPLLFASYGFHHSMELPIVACLLAHFYRNPKHYFYGWIFCVLIAAAHISFFQELFANLSSDTRHGENGYLTANGNDEADYLTGFRPDFILYSMMPVIVGYYATIKKKIQLSALYIYILNIYLITNSVWMLCMYASYSNRIAYLSWLMYPIVLIYPFLQENLGAYQYRAFSKIMLYHIGFTVFMEMVYYGGFISLLN